MAMKEIRSVETFDKYPSEEEKAKRNLDDRQREQSVVFVIDAESCVSLDYLWYKQYPVCTDAFHMAMMDTLLEQRGWKQRGKRANFKSGLSADEVLECIAFKEAYEETFDAVVLEDDQFQEIEMTVESFLELVDEKFEEKKKSWKIRYPDVATVEALIAILTAEGFDLTFP